MDKQLACAVFNRWNSGLPVSETNLYKAASLLGEDPDLALTEARFYTKLDNYLSRGGPMTSNEKLAFSLAVNTRPEVFEKTASQYGLAPEELILRTLSETNFVPYLPKLAQMGLDTPPQQGAAVSQNPEMRQGMDPQSIQQVTGNPAAMSEQDMLGNTLYKPTPTAPGQLPPGGPGSGGNMDQLIYNEANKDQIQGQKDEVMRQQMMAQTQQQPQQGSKEQIQQIYNQMNPDEKAQHAVPEANPQELPEIAQHIQQVEQQVGTAITDPAQIKKIYGEMQKAKKKEIDEAIKMQFQNQADASMAGQFGPIPARLGGGGGAPGAGGPPGGGDPMQGGGGQPPPQSPPGQGGSQGGPPSASGGPPGGSEGGQESGSEGKSLPGKGQTLVKPKMEKKAFTIFHSWKKDMERKKRMLEPFNLDAEMAASEHPAVVAAIKKHFPHTEVNWEHPEIEKAWTQAVKELSKGSSSEKKASLIRPFRRG